MILNRIVLILVSLFVLSNAKRSKEKDKSKLYELYPQLNSTDTNECVRGINNLAINMHSVDYLERMAQSGMHALNDIGSPYLCEDGQEDLAQYATLTLNITHVPTALISGLCLPRACTQE